MKAKMKAKRNYACEVSLFKPFKTRGVFFGQCCECMALFEPTLPKQIFCKPCRDEAWNGVMGRQVNEEIA